MSRIEPGRTTTAPAHTYKYGYRKLHCYMRLVLVLALSPGISAQGSPARADLPSNHQVVTFLTESIDWYRRCAAERLIATEGIDLAFVEDNRPGARQIVRLSLDFAREYAYIGTSTPGNQKGSVAASSSSSDLARFLQIQASIDIAGKQASQQIEEIKKKLATAHKADRGTLQAALDATQSRMEILKSASTTIQQLVDFVRAFGDRETGDLDSTINDLARTVPDVTNPMVVEPQAQRPDVPLPAKPRDSSILTLGAQVSTLRQKLRILDDEISRTEALRQSSIGLHTPLLAVINQRFVLDAPNALQVNDLRALQLQKDGLDQIAASVKTLSPAIVTLDKQRILLDAYQSRLKSWRATVLREDKKTWKNLILRLAGLALMVVALALIGAFARRAIRRHIQDSDRRNIMVAIQRVVVWIAIVIVAAFSFASDFASLATFFGLMTAGVAVALQSVLLSALGYLVLVGKLGVRTGDRVQISGVTGDVIEIGWLQFQLREIDSKMQRPTGQVVTFSNSFVFSSPGTGFSRLARNQSNQAQLDPAAQAAQLQEGRKASALPHVNGNA